MTSKQRADWTPLLSLHPADLVRAKIAAWWEHPLPPTFRGNRTFGAFLQWFDDIVTDGSSTGAPNRTVGPQDWLAEMQTGTPLGRSHYQDLIGEITDGEAKVRTLMQYGGVTSEHEAKTIISICEPC